ncbi:class Ib ribonucleoside-diphosphate reductase assembly flavoprotein NrdI [Corynebacterium riegelii]|uniref:class Ib ribonucleoside-diphosphate reductase assembly flavoprotein NrdI n=1 Tax=Corynebacterium riegelii TaxID=156976 RepID=UPI00254CEDCC|nr:class Ib ribonucleoside-diphosphate reductase assembly flavoprotein NrdI [Corynebacterium riegelii]MDK7179984.1 class Ib ribonucleoside-diphosphate reductase assembly flavoprotein NrdI [Corynebacterium riegelii]
MLLVYFSSTTENTKRFVEKVGLPARRIPLHRNDEPLVVNEPYILVCPTYGGGVSLTHENSRPVPPQVIRFLNNQHNRSFIRGVIAGGNSNFGKDFCRAGDVISAKCKVPFLYRFELMGAPEDVTRVRSQLVKHAERLGLGPVDAPVEESRQDENAERLARLREKYARKYAKRVAHA